MKEIPEPLRPEVRKVVAALAKLGACTLPEMRAVLRAVLGAAIAQSGWSATVTIHGPRVVVYGPDGSRIVPPVTISWSEHPASPS